MIINATDLNRFGKTKLSKHVAQLVGAEEHGRARIT